MSLFSLQIERHSLAGLLKHSSVFPEIDNIVSDNEYYNDVNRTLFSVIRSIYLKGEKPDPVIVAEKVKNLGISFKEDFDVYGYVDSLAHTTITENGAIKAFKELIQLRIKRELVQIGDKIKTTATNSDCESVNELLGECDKIYNGAIDLYSVNDVPVNIFENMYELAEARGNNPVNDMGYMTNFPEFNRLWGGLRPKNLYSIVSRPKSGKSTILNDLAFNTYLTNNKNIAVLSLDTEMETEDTQFRMLASLSGVPFWYLETGNFRKSPEMLEKVRAARNLIKSCQYHHQKIGNKDINQVCSIIRRWYYSKVGRGGKCIIVYDYIKTGAADKVDKGNQEYKIVGDKVDSLKKMAEEINAPILTAMQMNRSGESQNKKSEDVTDDSSAIALSDRLQWYASFVAIFRRKTLDEMAIDGKQFGTHKMIPTATRFQGRDAAGHMDMIKRTMTDGKIKYCNNYLNFNVENFKVEERGSLHDIVKAKDHNYEFNSKPENVELNSSENKT